MSKTPTSLPVADPAVDSHFHVFSAHTAMTGARYRPAYAAPLGNWSAAAGACGIGRGVLVQTSFMGTDNRELLELLAQQGERLRGVVVVDPLISAAALDRMDALGVRGIRLNLVGSNHELSAWSGSGGRLWDELARLDWHVEIHTDAGALPGVLRQLPQQLPLVIDHFGKPAAAARGDGTVRALLARSRHAEVHVKLSGEYRLHGLEAKALARIWRHELGSHRLLWGSDWPCTNHEACADYPALLNALHDWLAYDAAVADTLLRNPARLYWKEGC